jgi:CCR4-NOT transcription complex subunit 4
MSIKRESNNHRYNNHNYREKQGIEELTDARIITKNLVYIIGLSSNIANKEKLNKYEFLGQYGTIVKIVVNKNKAYNQNSIHGPSYSAYVTFSKPCEASIAILSLDDKMIDNHLIRASFGTTKYCSYFLKGIECNNKDCLFLHKLADESDIIKRGDLTSNKVIFTQQHNYAKKIADIYNPEVKKKILSSKKGKTVFPSPDIIYRTITVMEKENTSKNKKNSVNKKENSKYSPVKDTKINKEISDKTSKKTEYKNNNNSNKSYNDEDNYDDEEEEEDDEEYENEEDKSTNAFDEKNTKQKNNNSINNNSINNGNNKDSKNSKKKNLFLNREKSRFEFCSNSNNNNVENSNIVVPKHIFNLINKKIFLYNLTKYMNQKIIDKIFLDESIKSDNKTKNDEWTKFINDNIDISNNNNFNNNDELINDIDKINHFIINKVTSKTCLENK